MIGKNNLKMNEIDFKDKVAIITGASSDIGAETAVALAGYGARLTLVGKSEDALVRVAQQCVQKNKLVPLWLSLNLTYSGSCETTINKTLEMYGKIDILVNCAEKIVLSSLHDNSMEAFDEVMNINFRVPYHLSQLALPHLIQTKGNIINIGSSMSKRFKPGFLPYVISKNALETMTKHAAPELVSEGVRMNTISPGTTRMNLTAYYNPCYNSQQQLTYNDLVHDVPNEELLDPKEVALLICLTASDVFPHLNGTEILLDGGACLT